VAFDILRELTALASDRPRADTTAEAASAWFAAKARMHEYLSTQPGHDSSRESALASWAYERSRALLVRRSTA
jgi:hypothetical protein